MREGAKHKDPGIPKDQDQCDSCGFETRLLRKVENRLGSDRGAPPHYWMCEVCRSTFIANATLYPNQWPHPHNEIAAAIGWGINAILAAIEEKQ